MATTAKAPAPPAKGPKPVMYVEGLDGQVELREDRIIIHRKGLLNALFFGFNSRREIPLGAVSEVMFREATRIKYGVIEFIRGGSSVAERRKNTASCIVKFNRGQMDGFEKIKEKTFQLIEKHAKAKN